MLRRSATVLAERWVAAVGERVRLDLALGRHLEIIDELQTLVADNPLRERLHALLMLALYRAGRQAEALEAMFAKMEEDWTAWVKSDCPST